MTQRQIASLIAAAALLAVPAAVAFEHSEMNTWQQRLFLPELTPETSRHTPRFVEGAYLPPVLPDGFIIRASDGITLARGRVLIPAGTTTIIEAGSRIFWHEFSEFIVEGTLHIQGTDQQPVFLETNELHPENKLWHGITVLPGGQATVTFARIRHASPSVSCLPGSQLTMQHTTMELGSVGAWVASPVCTIASSVIRTVQTGVVALGAQPSLPDTVIHASRTSLHIVR